MLIRKGTVPVTINTNINLGNEIEKAMKARDEFSSVCKRASKMLTDITCDEKLAEINHVIATIPQAPSMSRRQKRRGQV